MKKPTLSLSIDDACEQTDKENRDFVANCLEWLEEQRTNYYPEPALEVSVWCLSHYATNGCYTCPMNFNDRCLLIRLDEPTSVFIDGVKCFSVEESKKLCKEVLNAYKTYYG